MAYARVFHFDEDLISSDLIQDDRCQLEVCARLFDHKGLSFDIGKRHVFSSVVGRFKVSARSRFTMAVKISVERPHIARTGSI